ncbi:hypothetical protein LZ554_007579 [Drepanopeziza brunnea f. sp. 'monogermtubi']|nr:hypothetical protein LZ554_007579 [Drepanopeziza brunnea f. sp. 'monogermtubi']
METTNFNPDTDIPSLKDKVIFITGGTAGIGAASLQALAQHEPAHIYFGGRNQQAAASLISKIRETAPRAPLTFVGMDLSCLASVKAACEHFAHDRLDVLMCNAGVMEVPPAVSPDGYEIRFATNHLGHAMLIRQLLPVMLRTARAPGGDVRIVILSSRGWAMHPKGGIQFSRLKTKMDGYVERGFLYSQSKLANLVYAAELARRYPSITSVSIHPGVVETGMSAGMGRIAKTFVQLENLLLGASYVKETEGMLNQLWAATLAKKSELVNGGYYEPIGVLYNGKLDATATDPDLARRLWEFTEEALDKIL